jgi:hypothetical protein
MDEDVPQDGLHVDANSVWQWIASAGAGAVVAAVIALFVVAWILRRK